MRIGIDARCLMEGSRTGVEEYTIGFIKKILEQNQSDDVVLFFNSFKKTDNDLSWLNEYENVEVRDFGFPNKLLNFLMWFFGWPKIDIMLGGVDLFFAPNIAFIALSKRCRFVLTVHDLSFERFPEYFSPKRRLWHFLLNPRKLCHRANKLLPVSHSTKCDLATLYGIPKCKMEVLLPSMDLDRFFKKEISKRRIKKTRGKYGLPREFILYFGTIEPRKNIITIIRAFEELKKRNKKTQSMKLVIVGSLGWSYQLIVDAMRKSEFEKDILMVGFIEDEDKAIVYKLAKMFVYPSFFEGFGFPPVEAMASGIPTITSNCSSIPEVVSDAVILVDPYRPFEIFLAMQLLLDDEKVYNEYVKKGLKKTESLRNAMKNKKLIKKLV